MVGTVNFVEDFCGFYFWQKFVRDEKIIYAPADVAVARAGFHVPIRVHVFFVGIEMTKDVRIAMVDDLIYPRALFREKAGVLFIFFWPREVDAFMRGVYVAAEDNIFLFFSEMFDVL